MFTNFTATKFSNLWNIESDCVEDDYHALVNLISKDEAKKKIGFMAFSASGPPVNITLKCKILIDLKAIKVRVFKYFLIAFIEKNYHILDTLSTRISEIHKVSNIFRMCKSREESPSKNSKHSLKRR
jgi:Family of unknown function (DUF5918)